MKTIDTLVKDIYDMIDDGDIDVNVEALRQFGEECQNAVYGMLKRNNDRRGSIRLSSMGQPCSRKQWYEHNDAPREPLQPHTRIKFVFGHIIEARVLLLAKEAGHTVTDEQKEVEVDGVVGHMDAKIDGVVVDVKSASSAAFKKFKDGTLNSENDSFGYLTQISAYLEAEGEHEGAFLAMDKQLGKLALMPVTKKLGVSYEINARKEVVLSDTVPERAFYPVPDGVSGNMKLPVNCSYCDFKHSCFPGVRTFAYGNGPRYLTTVAVLPKVPEVYDE